MTTLAAIITKDALVMGCDSLASVMVPMVDPFRLADFFDPGNGYKMRIDTDGQPMLKDFRTVYGRAVSLPYNHMTHVDKLFSLSPLPMGVMVTGLSSIGNFTVKNLINQFKAVNAIFKDGSNPKNYTVKSVADKLLKFMHTFYDKEYGGEQGKPSLELMIGGYSKQKHIPSVLRIYVEQNKVVDTIDDFGIVFGGQMTEIQRLVFGTDALNQVRITDRFKELFGNYRQRVLDLLTESGIHTDIPETELKDFAPFAEGWNLYGFDAMWGDFSERNAIECVKFFIDIMIKSQQFSNSLPTVGGDVHIAVITKTDGFKALTHHEMEGRNE